jgi:hypothetical protein
MKEEETGINKWFSIFIKYRIENYFSINFYRAFSPILRGRCVITVQNNLKEY